MKIFEDYIEDKKFEGRNPREQIGFSKLLTKEDSETACKIAYYEGMINAFIGLKPPLMVSSEFSEIQKDFFELSLSWGNYDKLTKEVHLNTLIEKHNL